jgi:multidrug efflux pump subunit AcrA (membrane-fusion protein)
MAVRITGPGAVIAPREPLLDIVPAHEKLVIGARVPTQDIEHVQAGAAAEVRLLGGDARRRAPLPARVTFVSADRVSDPSGTRAWFDVTVEVERAVLRQQQPPLQLQPGMPAEVYVATAGRTLIEYLAKPFDLFTQRALREP